MWSKDISRRTSDGGPAVVALIDSGIDPRMSDIGNFIRKSTGFSIKDGYIAEDKERPIESEHATAISLIIREIAKDVEFISINILNERLATDFRVLLYALYYTLDYALRLDGLKPDVIHLSLGTSNLLHYFHLRDIVIKAAASDILIVASADNGLGICLPASMNGVLGVKSSPDLKPDRYSFDGRFFRAPSTLNGISGSDCLERQDYKGCSLAAAYITGHIAKIVLRDGWTGRDDILTKLKAKSKAAANGDFEE